MKGEIYEVIREMKNKEKSGDETIGTQKESQKQIERGGEDGQSESSTRERTDRQRQTRDGPSRQRGGVTQRDDRWSWIQTAALAYQQSCVSI